jgi:cytochrome c6
VILPITRAFLRGVLGVVIVLFLCFSLKAQETGEALFKAKCAMCHGADGSGKTPMGQSLKLPDLHSEQVQKMAEAEIKAVIAKGKNKMPAYENKLNQEQIEKLVAYIRALAKH